MNQSKRSQVKNRATLFVWLFLLCSLFLQPIMSTTAFAAETTEGQHQQVDSQAAIQEDEQPQQDTDLLEEEQSTAQPMAKSKGTVVVDAGHGPAEKGYDPGASAPDGSINEATLNPQLAGKLASLLQRQGYTVYTTLPYAAGVPHLSTASKLSLYQRAQLSNAVHPDAYISIHHNKHGSGFNDASGALTIYDGEQRAPYMARESQNLANTVIQSVRSLGYTRGNRHSIIQNRKLSVLHYSKAAATMVEVGFLSNRHDLAVATSPAKQQEIAEKIADGLAKHFKEFPPASYFPGDVTGPTMDALVFSEASPTYAPNFTIAAHNVQDESGLRGVRFRLWREGDSSSKKVVYANPQQNREWSYGFRLADFGNKAGTYKVTAYGTDRAGNDRNMGTTEIVIKEDRQKPVVRHVLFGEQSPSYAPTFAIQASDVTDPSGVASVKFRVWQDGVAGSAHSYDGINQGNGCWDMLFKLSDWKSQPGLYRVNVFATDMRGNTGRAASGSIRVEKDTQPPTMRRVVFGEHSPTDQPSFAIQAQGVRDNDQVEQVKFRVWNTTVGNHTVKTYEGIDQGNGNWDMLLDLHDYEYKNGLYRVQVYGYDRSGNGQRMGGGQIEVQGDFDTQQPTMQKVEFSEEDGTTANTFTIIAKDVQDPAGVEKVRFRVHRVADGASSYKTYEGQRRGNDWTMDFKLHDFKNQTGSYRVRVYGYDNMGNAGYMGGGNITVTGDSSPPYVESVSFSAGKPAFAHDFFIYANGVSDPSGIENMRFRIWRTEDASTVRTVTAKKDGNRYYVPFRLKDFDLKGGDYTVKVYGTDTKGNTGMVAGDSVFVNRILGNVFIMGTPEATVQQMVNFYMASGYAYPAYYKQSPRSTDLYSFAKLYYDVCAKEGVRADIAWAQMCHETGYLSFRGDVNVKQFNFAGIGATGGGEPGFDFAARYGNNARGIRYGVIAHVQHLKAYASIDKPVYLNADKTPIDPRWSLVGRGSAPTVEALTGKWAADPGYSNKVILNLNKLVGMPQTAWMQEESIVQEADVPLREQLAEEALPVEPEQPIEERPIEYSIMQPEGEPSDVTKEQLMNYYVAHAPGIDSPHEVEEGTGFPLYYQMTLEEFAELFIKEAAAENVRPEVAFAKAMQDTNFLRYDGQLRMEDHVFWLEQDQQDHRYVDVKTGIRALVQHLKCLASEDALWQEKVDVLWADDLRGICKDAAQLGDAEKGAALLAMIGQLKSNPKHWNAPVPSEQPEDAQVVPPEAVPEEEPPLAEPVQTAEDDQGMNGLGEVK